jgi:hypothetical protein
MVTRKLFTPSLLVVGLTAGLLAQQAAATEELVVYGTTAVGIRVDQQVFRTDIDNYVRSLNEQLKIALDLDLKRTLAPKLEFASNELRARG